MTVREHEVHVLIQVCNLAEPSRCSSGQAFVDTGATLTTVPKRVAEELGLAVLERRTSVTAAGPREVDIVALWTVVEGERLPSAAIIGERDEYLLGLADLEMRGLAVDPMTGRLIPSPLRS